MATLKLKKLQLMFIYSLAWFVYCVSCGNFSDFWINHPGCGVSEANPNHRRPRLFDRSIRLDFADLEVDQLRTKGRIIDGEVSRENSWPWQVHNKGQGIKSR
jgi:hypothetical protein